MITQCEQVLLHLQQIGPITSDLAAEKYGIKRLASRICDLRKQGVGINTRWIKVHTRYGNGITEVKEYCLRGDTDGKC